jgi:hypothetical protein
MPGSCNDRMKRTAEARSHAAPRGAASIGARLARTAGPVAQRHVRSTANGVLDSTMQKVMAFGATGGARAEAIELRRARAGSDPISAPPDLLRQRLRVPQSCAGGTMPRPLKLPWIAFLGIAVADYQGIGWAFPAGSEPGWGINVSHAGDIVFATWFTFDDHGNPTWYVVAAAKVSPTVYRGTLCTGAGPPFGATPWNSADIVPRIATRGLRAVRNGGAMAGTR